MLWVMIYEKWSDFVVHFSISKDKYSIFSAAYRRPKLRNFWPRVPTYPLPLGAIPLLRNIDFEDFQTTYPTLPLFVIIAS